MKVLYEKTDGQPDNQAFQKQNRERKGRQENNKKTQE